MSFTYNDDGLRVTKTVNGVVTTYYYQGSLLIAEETNSQILVYIYDANGAPLGFKYRGVDYASGTWDTYGFEKNLQGDIVAVYDTSTGKQLIGYKYNAWGVCTTSYYNSGSTTTATKNPFKYRGYYYDSNLGLYYLQSRYYDQNTGRFINADSALSHSMLGYNMFAYCENNPVNYYDPTGEDGEEAVLLPLFGLPLLDGHIPIGDILAFAIILCMIVAAAKADTPPQPKVSEEEPPDISPESEDAEEIGDDADSSITEEEKDYVRAKNNKTANKWAEEFGYSDAESLKDDFVGRSNRSKFNMFKNRSNGEIVLIGIKTGIEVFTELFMK